MSRTLFFKQIEVGTMANFAYLVGDPIKKEVFVIDPAWQIDTILKLAEKEKLTLSGILLTHAHFDHCNGVEELVNKKEMPVYIHEEEFLFLKSVGMGREHLTGFLPEKNLKKIRHNDKIKIGDVEITVLHTPGHTPGSQCFLVENNLISGDTLFISGCGRVDLRGSSPEKMFESLRQISKLPDDTVIWPGHDYGNHVSASLKDEKIKNPYLKLDSFDDFLHLMGMERSSKSVL